MALTKEQIFEAANELEAAGQKPTLAAVRKFVGGGSFTTVQEAMKEWKEQKLAKETSTIEELPPSLNIVMQEFGHTVWTTATRLATVRLTTERDALESDRLELEAAKQEAADLADQLAEEVDALKALVTSMEKELHTAKENAVVAKTETATERERANAAEVRITEIEKRVSVLNTELTQAHQQNMELIKAFSGKAETDKAP